MAIFNQIFDSEICNGNQKGFVYPIAPFFEEEDERTSATILRMGGGKYYCLSKKNDVHFGGYSNIYHDYLRMKRKYLKLKNSLLEKTL